MWSKFIPKRPNKITHQWCFQTSGMLLVLTVVAAVFKIVLQIVVGLLAMGMMVLFAIATIMWGLLKLKNKENK